MNIVEFVTNTVRRALEKFHEDHPSGDVLVAEYNVTTAEELLAYLGKASFAPLVVKRGTDYYTALLFNQRDSESALVRVLGSSGGDYYLFNYTVTGNTWASSSYGLQKKLVSGSDIKTINGESLLGEGNISSYVAPADTGWKNTIPEVGSTFKYRRIGDVVWVTGAKYVYSTNKGDTIVYNNLLPEGFTPDIDEHSPLISDKYEGYADIFTGGNITLGCSNDDSSERYLIFSACYPVAHLSNEEIAALVPA